MTIIRETRDGGYEHITPDHPDYQREERKQARLAHREMYEFRESRCHPVSKFLRYDIGGEQVGFYLAMFGGVILSSLLTFLLGSMAMMSESADPESLGIGLAVFWFMMIIICGQGLAFVVDTIENIYS